MLDGGSQPVIFNCGKAFLPNYLRAFWNALNYFECWLEVKMIQNNNNNQIQDRNLSIHIFCCILYPDVKFLS